MTKTGDHPVFIVFEGLDGAGKSTAARITAERLDARYLTTPTPAMRVYRDEIISSFGGSQEACQLFYLSTVFAASREVRTLLGQGLSVVLDRYFLSTQAYAAFRGSALLLDDLGDLLHPANLTVFLEAPLAVRHARLIERGESAADRETLAPDADAYLRKAHRRRAGLKVIGRFLSIDTSLLSPEAVAGQVVDELGRLAPRRSAEITTRNAPGGTPARVPASQPVDRP